ncbi:DUF4192 domain-containing protein [Jiangella aurantiaca]|uniref:DUF4192 domain-containing protein n=1 Tax=Jiangella aurantiaca TaxID=2530373 RepID=A0A4R5A6L4_9ACTN|nr:DUF4192 domain-containing protein [Jiangella aurantiaca]TDD66700.1 DUF4192 domain-containing protein [Jiangella aurantiaca]
MKIREHLNGTATAADPGDLLAAIPHLMGFHPQSSVVVVHVDLEERRTGTLLRLDLPAADDYESYAAQLATRIEYGQPDGVILVCYGDDGAPPGGGGPPPGALAAEPSHPPDAVPGGPQAAGTAATPGVARGELPHQALIELVLGELTDGPVAVLGTAYVDGGRWWTYDCDHPGCCPAEGVPLPEPGLGAAADVAARAALAGRRTLSSRRELEDSLRGPSGADEKAMAGVFERVDRELAAEALTDGVEVLRGRTLALARLLLARSAEGRLELSDDDVARLSLGAADLLVRDRFIAFDGADPAAWLGLLTALARRTPDARAAAICSVVAWVAYQQGDGAVANVALDRVLSIDPRHTMAVLLRDCLDGQVSPGHITALTREAVRAAERARKEVSAAGAA